jgi:hypothetical protein
LVIFYEVVLSLIQTLEYLKEGSLMTSSGWQEREIVKFRILILGFMWIHRMKKNTENFSKGIPI